MRCLKRVSVLIHRGDFIHRVRCDFDDIFDVCFNVPIGIPVFILRGISAAQFDLPDSQVQIVIIRTVIISLVIHDHTGLFPGDGFGDQNVGKGRIFVITKSTDIQAIG